MKNKDASDIGYKPDLLLFPQWFIDNVNKLRKRWGLLKIKTFNIWKEETK